MADRPATLADAFALVEAHRRSGCLHYAVDYAERVRGADRDQLQRGVKYIVESLEKRMKEVNQ